MSKRQCGRFVGAVLFVTAGPTFGGICIYEEDFSTGALGGWEGGHARDDYGHSDAPYYYWDSGREALYVKQPNKNIDGDDHYFTHPIDYDGGSFILSYDMYVEEQQYDATLAFGLSTDPNNAWSGDGLDESHWRIGYGRSDGGPGTAVVGRASGETFYSPVWPYDAEGHWWHHQFTYDADAGSVHSLVFRRDNPSIVLYDVTDIPGGAFTADMDWLVLSDNRNHHHPSTTARTYGIGYLDNICFVPEPGTLALLGVGVAFFARRRRRVRRLS